MFLLATQTFLKTEGLSYAVKKEDYLKYFRWEGEGGLGDRGCGGVCACETGLEGVRRMGATWEN